MSLRSTIILLVVIGSLATALRASAQVSYGQYYQKNVGKSGQSFRGTNTSAYLFDKYYKGKSHISPYANLNRHAGGGNSYQTYIRPEQQRRETFQAAGRQYIKQRKMQGNIGHTNYGFAQQLQRGVPSASDIPKIRTPSPYSNQYGGRRY